MSILSFRRNLLLACTGALVGRPAAAEPPRAIRIVVGFAAGGSTDLVARLYAPHLQQALGAPVIVDNRPGASQLLAIRALLASPPDGSVLFVGTGSSLVQGPGIRTDLPYDPLKDFSHISLMGSTPALLLISKDLPVGSVAELVAYAKANPGKMNYGSAGAGSASHLQMELMKQAAGLDIAHIPFRADQDVMRELMSGALQVGLAVANGAVSLAQAGRLRCIAVVGQERIAALPDVPTLNETGIEALRNMPDYTIYGLVGPAGMNPALVAQVNRATVAAAASPDVVARMRERFFVPGSSTPGELRDVIARELPLWRSVGRTLDLRASDG